MKKLINALVIGVKLMMTAVIIWAGLLVRKAYLELTDLRSAIARPAVVEEQRDTDWRGTLGEKAQKYGVPVGMLWVIFNHESLGGKRNYRFEPGMMDAALRITKNTDEARMLASSHCPMHVMGTTARQYGSTWEKITKSDDECADVAAHVVSDCLDTCASKKRISEQVFCAFRCYNGGPKAKGQDSAEYAANRSAELFDQWLSDLYPRGIR